MNPDPERCPWCGRPVLPGRIACLEHDKAERVHLDRIHLVGIPPDPYATYTVPGERLS